MATTRPGAPMVEVDAGIALDVFNASDGSPRLGSLYECTVSAMACQAPIEDQSGTLTLPTT